MALPSDLRYFHGDGGGEPNFECLTEISAFQPECTKASKLVMECFRGVSQT